MKAISCVFIGGKQVGADCLKALVRAGVRPALIVANSDDTGTDTWHESLVRVAKELGFECIAGKKVKDPDVVAMISKSKPEIIFCIGSTELIPPSVLAIPPKGTINLHPALLPKYRGRYSIPHAIFNGEKETGVTLHFMDEGIDSGPIIIQKSYPLADNDTARSAYDKFTSVAVELFVQFLDMLDKGPIPSAPQNEADATYYPKGLPNNGEIDWAWDGATIRRFIRAMTFEPLPPPSFMLGEKRMIITDEKSFTAQKQSDTKKN